MGLDAARFRHVSVARDRVGPGCVFELAGACREPTRPRTVVPAAPKTRTSPSSSFTTSRPPGSTSIMDPVYRLPARVDIVDQGAHSPRLQPGAYAINLPRRRWPLGESIARLRTHMEALRRSDNNPYLSTRYRSVSRETPSSSAARETFSFTAASALVMSSRSTRSSGTGPFEKSTWR